MYTSVYIIVYIQPIPENNSALRNFFPSGRHRSCALEACLTINRNERSSYGISLRIVYVLFNMTGLDDCLSKYKQGCSRRFMMNSPTAMSSTTGISTVSRTANFLKTALSSISTNRTCIDSFLTSKLSLCGNMPVCIYRRHWRSRLRFRTHRNVGGRPKCCNSVASLILRAVLPVSICWRFWCIAHHHNWQLILLSRASTHLSALFVTA